ncbi:MAG: hypothetical protein Q8R36_01500 [bacterium]|nr:hypothetical protein [bacterium]
MIRLIAFMLALVLASAAYANEEQTKTITIRSNPDGGINYLGTYDWVSSDADLQEGLMAVRLGQDFFHICNKDGLPAYAETYDGIADFSEGFAPVRRAERWWHVKKNGERLYEYDFPHVGSFRHGVAMAWGENGEQFFIGTNGERLTKEYVFLIRLRNGEAKGQLKNGTWETFRVPAPAINESVVVTTAQACNRTVTEGIAKRKTNKRVQYKLFDGDSKEEFPRARNENGREFHVCQNENRLYPQTYTDLTKFRDDLASGKRKDGQKVFIHLSKFKKFIAEGCPTQ